MHNQSDGIGQIAAALAAVQRALQPAVKDKQNPHLRNRYADLGSVWEACRDLLADNGLSVVQRGVNDGGVWGLETVLLHASGEWISGVTPLLSSPNKGTNDMQALGAAITYARRYGLAAMVGVLSDDDDAHSSGPRREERQHQSNGHAVNEGPPGEVPADGKFWSFMDGLAKEFGAENSYYVVNRIYKFAAKDGHVDGTAKQPGEKADQLREWVKGQGSQSQRKTALAYLRSAADPNSPEFA